MEVKQLRIKVQDLTLGMYVSSLDRPWSETPFPLQGFYVRKPKDIAVLKTYCEYVGIDITKGKAPINYGSPATPIGGSSSSRMRTTSSAEPLALKVNSAAASIPPSPIPIKHGVYETTVPLRIEARMAERIVRNLKGQLALATKQLNKGKGLDVVSLRKASDQMVASVLRCPDAMTWLLRLRQKDQYTNDHSLRSALWALQYARFVGMAKLDIEMLCLGVLLKDVGKLRLPNALLRQGRRTEEQETEYRQFVQYGVEMLSEEPNIPPQVISIVKYHCERLDGSGYPQGVTGRKIPLLARIAGIATTYDAFANPREAEEPVAPSRAVSLLYNMRSSAFQEDLVVSFIQSVGLYPTGTMVELTTGDLAVVLDQQPASRLLPRVAVLHPWSDDLNKSHLIINLQDQEESKRILLAAGRLKSASADRIAIARDLEPTGYDVDFNKISQAMLEQQVGGEVESGLFARIKARFGI